MMFFVAREIGAEPRGVASGSLASPQNTRSLLLAVLYRAPQTWDAYRCRQISEILRRVCKERPLTATISMNQGSESYEGSKIMRRSLLTKRRLRGQWLTARSAVARRRL